MALKEKQLMTAIDAGMDNYAMSDTETLLEETGKTRQELLSAISSDDEIISCREDIHSAILSAPWRIWGEGISEDIINQFYKVIRKHADTLADVAIVAKWNGYCVAEYNYDKSPLTNMFVIKDVLNKDGELDKYLPKRDGSLVFITQDGEKPINDEYRQVKIALITSKATPVRPTGELYIIRIYPAVALRKRGFAYAGQFIARYAQPYVIGKQGSMDIGFDGDSVVNTALNKFTTILFGLLNGGAATISDGASVEFHQLNGDGAAFERLESLCNQRIQKLLLGRVKTSELSSGSRAAQETDDKVRGDRMNGYLTLMTKLCQHAIDAMIAVNQINAPKGIWFEYEQQSELDPVLANTVKTYSDTGQIKFTKDFWLNKVGLEKQHFEVVESTPATTAKLSQNIFTLSEKKPPTNNDNEIIYPKLEAILSNMADSQDYDDFLNRLDGLDLSDVVMLRELSQKMTEAYVKGLGGVTNERGENQL